MYYSLKMETGHSFAVIYLLLAFYACYDVRGMLLGETCAGDFNCTYNGMVFCGHIPCPLEPCAVQLVHRKGDCCAHCPSGPAADDPMGNPCPYNCTQAGVHYCFPIPCAQIPCVDGRIKQGECCPSCPNGPNCSAPDGHVISYNHWQIIDGKNCTCITPPGYVNCI
ncbi:kielin/chordin-like protein [Mya arenaria]|uniref:kielin/chordin-like protein n=1 Tax=Mya arenaria TaxID=6604 RepID=UPI0022E77E19|nr:kielin/chordin-like protein [Mya arenaria]